MTTPSRKVICYIATSADGYIARPDGNIDWLTNPEVPREPKVGDYGYADFVKDIDTVLWGRTTWDQVQSWMESGDAGMAAGTRSYVFTSRPETGAAKPDVEYTNEPVKPFMERLRAEPGRDIWMMGGGGIIGTFLDAGELDEFIIHVMPVLIGEGIPLIAPRHREIPLRLVETKSYDDGVVMLHYAIERPDRPTAA